MKLNKKGMQLPSTKTIVAILLVITLAVVIFGNLNPFNWLFGDGGEFNAVQLKSDYSTCENSQLKQYCNGYYYVETSEGYIYVTAIENSSDRVFVVFDEENQITEAYRKINGEKEPYVFEVDMETITYAREKGSLDTLEGLEKDEKRDYIESGDFFYPETFYVDYDVEIQP